MALTEGDLAQIELAVEKGVWNAIGQHEEQCAKLRKWQTIAIVAICSAAGGGGVASIITLLGSAGG